VYTQCSKCETVFRLSADVLRAAGGQVRCGRCGEVFNALARLAEDPSAFPAGESHLDMETRANDILESAVPPLEQLGEASAAGDDIIEFEEFESRDGDFARLQLVEKFVEDSSTKPSENPAKVKAPPAPPRPAAPAAPAAPAPKPKPAPAPAAPTTARAPSSPAAPPRAPTRSPAPPQSSAAAPAAPAPTKSPAPAAAPKPVPTAAPTPAARVAPPAKPSAPPPTGGLDDGSMEFTLPPGELDRVFIERAASAPASEKVAKSDAISPDPGLEPSPLPLSGTGLDVSERVRREMMLGISEPEGDEAAVSEISTAPRRTIPEKLWLGLAVVLALLLVVQLIHGNRDWLATHAPLRGPLRGLYAAFGVAVAAPANLSAYQLRQWGVTGDPSASGTLRVRASILNTAAQLQPYPLLRVTLANRFGTKIGMRDFEAAEYMGKPMVRMLAPGERADATLDIVDPGKDAEGFEIDVCIRGADQKVACTGDAAPQPKRPRGGS
jgi:predicted Zn finger-like uncharacterized protein